MPDFLCTEMQEFFDMQYGLKRKDRIFNITKSYLHHEMDRGSKAAGVKRIRIHDLRHSCASLLLANGVPLKHIQEWLGHSDFTTTANIYAHLDYKSKITSAQAMETGLALPEGGDFSSRWGSIGVGENF